MPVWHTWKTMNFREKARPELLSPAGDMERLRMALAYGADAVYLAGKSFGMRASAASFDEVTIYEAVRLCHEAGVSCHVTVNTMPRGEEMQKLPSWLEILQDAGADALILADLGAFRLAEHHAPKLERHISTQQSVANAVTAQAWFDLGAKRVILARELSLEEVRAIRQETDPALELEVFVHGAMCISWSGRCLLSNYMTGRDGNRGECAQPCRYQYALVEEKRPGQYFPVFEGDTGSYILNSRDMCMIDHVGELIDAGLDAFKIEGRAKSAYYTAAVTGAYRRAIDAAREGKPLEEVWRREVEKVSHRPYSTGFWFGWPGQVYEAARYIRDWQVCAVVESCEANGWAILSLRNKFCRGDRVEIVGPGVVPTAFVADEMTDSEGKPLAEARHPEMKFRLHLPMQVPALSILRRQTETSSTVPRPSGAEV